MNVAIVGQDFFQLFVNSLNFHEANALTAATHVIVPLQCEYYALEGLTNLMATIDRVKASTNESLEVQGVAKSERAASTAESGSPILAKRRSRRGGRHCRG